MLLQNSKIFIQILIFTLSSLTLARDGGWVSSGGDGVVCFESKVMAAQVEALIVKNKKFPADFLNKIESVEALEMFESGLEDKYTRAILAPSFEKLISDRRAFIKAMSPVFYMQLQILDEELNPKNWIARDEIAEIDDSIDRKDVRKKNSRCVLAQIFDRQSFSRPNKKPLIKMLYQADLWARLSHVDKALLYFHESFYTIGREIGVYAEKSHTNSRDVRITSRFVMTDRLINHWEDETLKKEAVKDFDKSYDVGLAVDSLKGMSFRADINSMYGDFPLLFGDDVEAILKKHVGAKESQATRFASFRKFIFESRRFMNICKKDRSFHSKIDPKSTDREKEIIEHCKFVTMHPMRVEKYFVTLSPQEASEMAFIYFTHWLLDVRDHVFPAETLLAWDLEGSSETSPENKKHLKYACFLISERIQPSDEDEAKVLKRALDYCEQFN